MAAPPPRSPLAWFLIPLVVGYLLASLLPAMPLLLACLGGAFSAFTVGAAWIKQKWAAALWPWLAFIAGLLLAGSYLQERMKPPAGWETLPPREAELTLKVGRLFNSADDRVHGFASVAETSSHLSDLIGKTLYFSMNSDSGASWPRGTRLNAIGILEMIPAETAGEDAFLGFLLQSGAHFQYRRVALREAPVTPPGFFAFCAWQQDRFEQFLRRGTMESTAIVDVYVAMLLGRRAELSEVQKNAFLQTGTLHLFAISGLHIGVIAFSLHSLLVLLRVPEKPAALIGLSLLLCFVGITGTTPSAVRAFLMVLFFWGARFFKRAPNPVAALANSAFFVLLIFPHQLWSPGFQLSYSVVAGILLLGLPLGGHLREKWTLFSGLPPEAMTHWQRRAADFTQQVALMFAVSLSATLLSSPLGIHYFEHFTPGAILLNLLLIPAAGLVIVAGFISVMLNLIGFGILGTVFNHAAWLVIGAMEAIVNACPALPGLFWQARFRSGWQGPGLVFLLLGTLLICAHHQWKAPIFHFATPFLLFAAWLLFAVRLTYLAQ